MIARLAGVTLSVLLHAGLIALLLAWSAVDWTRPLFVDLVEHADAPGSLAAGPASAPAPRPTARAAGTAPAPSRGASRPAPAPPAAPSAPTPSPVPQPAEVAAPAAPSPPTAPNLAVEPLAAPADAAVPAQEGRGAASDNGSGAAAGSGSRTQGDADRGSGAGPGSSVALAAPGVGGSGAPPAEYGPYLRQFRQRVQESLVYPLAARRQGLRGTVELHVWLEATGRVRDVQVVRSSTHDVLDDAALETVRRLGPVPFPESLSRRPLLIRIPLVYDLR